MQEKWPQITSILTSSIPQGQWKVWLAPMKPHFGDKSLTLYAPNAFVAHFAQARFSTSIQDALNQACGQGWTLRITTGLPTDSSASCNATPLSGPAHAVTVEGETAAPTTEALAPAEVVTAPTKAKPQKRAAKQVRTGKQGPAAKKNAHAQVQGKKPAPAAPSVRTKPAAPSLPAMPAAPSVLATPSMPVMPSILTLPSMPANPHTSTTPPVQEGPAVASRIPSPRPLPSMQLALPITVTNKNTAAVKNWRFSFEDFVVGPSNELAYAASKTMCNEYMQSNTLYLNSSPGLGKTHLMQAVGKSLSLCSNKSSPRMEYLTAEEFTSQFLYSLHSRSVDQFKSRYRGLDLLLLEDVHFLQSKEQTQIELLATMKAIHDRGGKVVLTSSFAPREMRAMDDQLLSRLSAGFLSSIERPDFATRCRIFRHKAAIHQVLLPQEIEEVLAEHIKADVRQIESCLQNLILKAQIFNSGITMQMAWDVISNYAAHSPELDMDAIIRNVCKLFSLSHEQLMSTRRKQEYVMARNTAFYLARKHTELSLEAIGQRFNKRHSTVLKGITNLEREISRQTPVGKQAEHTLSLIERTTARAQ